MGNDANDRACRTKLRAKTLGDFEKLFMMWDVCGWHRVTFYGDLKEPLFALARCRRLKGRAGNVIRAK